MKRFATHLKDGFTKVYCPDIKSAIFWSWYNMNGIKSITKKNKVTISTFTPSMLKKFNIDVKALGGIRGV